MLPVRWVRVSATLMLTLATFALATVLVGVAIALTRPPQPPASDEGTLAHLFQISVALLLPATVFYLATADWSHPSRAARPLIVAGAFALLAFALVFYFERVASKLG